MRPSSRRPVVGIAWAGRVSHPKDRERSLSLRQLIPYLIDSVQWISLQKEIRPVDSAWLSERPIWTAQQEIGDFADLAALIANVDLVISVDTAVAHLAGALGKPVWILLPHVADWRWLQDRDDSPWYPSARLFRQSSRGDWTSVLDRVAAALQYLFG
jgi:ADP-heptose:LPS heptosyltransferase